MSNPPQVYGKYELLFTPHLIPRLRNLRNEEWAQLIDALSILPETHSEVMAFALMMVNLGSCLTCEMDSYRAQRGCAVCAQQTIISFKGTDKQLLKRYENTLKVFYEQESRGELERAV